MKGDSENKIKNIMSFIKSKNKHSECKIILEYGSSGFWECFLKTDDNVIFEERQHKTADEAIDFLYEKIMNIWSV